MFRTRSYRSGPFLFLALSALACGGSSLTAPGSATLQITTATSGTELDPDGYTVQVDAGVAQAIGLTGSAPSTDIAPGNHTVQLAGLAPNCSVTGDNPRTVSVAAGQNATVDFVVTCGATTGGLQVTTTTTGPSPDADGYTVIVDGTNHGTLAAGGAVTIAGLTPGNHAVGLSGVAANCQVQGDNPRSVAVTVAAGGSVAFAITCAAPPVNAGSLRVTTATTGGNLDPDGYLFAVDGAPTQPLGVNATATLNNIAAGAHAVMLSGLAANCTVQGVNPQSVTVAGGGTGDAKFTISCTAVGGSASKLVFVSNRNASQNHLFTVNADGSGLTELSQPASNHSSPTWAPDGSKIALANGGHIAVMNADGTGVHDLTTGPMVDGAPLWSPAGGKVMFLRSSGGGTDTDIYVMNADGSGQVNLTNHPQAYFGLAWSPAGDKVGFSTGGWEIFVANPDGSGLTKLADGLGPVWSPDGRRIAFVRVVNLVSDIWSMNADGSDQRQLTHSVLPAGASEGGAGAPAWSPDGQRIAFHGGVTSPNSSLPDRFEVFVMNADGSNQTALGNPAEAEANPRWSPDGGKIAFQVRDCCNEQSKPDIVVINADGSGRVNVSQNPAADFEFAWKP